MLSPVPSGKAISADITAYGPSKLWWLIFTGLILIILIGIANASAHRP